MKRMVYTATVLIALTTSASAKLAAFGLDEMIRKADIIVVGKVEAVSPKSGAPRNATVQVTEVLKGAPGEKVLLNVRRTWPCDVSEAKAGERILLFVQHDQEKGQNLIYASGRGRMPIDEVDGKTYATFWSEVCMPKEIEIIDGPEPQLDFIRRASLQDLKNYIGKILKEISKRAAEE